MISVDVTKLSICWSLSGVIKAQAKAPLFNVDSSITFLRELVSTEADGTVFSPLLSASAPFYEY